MSNCTVCGGRTGKKPSVKTCDACRGSGAARPFVSSMRGVQKWSRSCRDVPGGNTVAAKRGITK